MYAYYMKLPRYKTVSGKQEARVFEDGSREFWSWLTKIASIDTQGNIALYNGYLNVGGVQTILDGDEFGYSRTTVQYLEHFLEMSLDEIRKAIKDGKIKLED